MYIHIHVHNASIQDSISNYEALISLQYVLACARDFILVSLLVFMESNMQRFHGSLH